MQPQPQVPRPGAIDPSLLVRMEDVVLEVVGDAGSVIYDPDHHLPVVQFGADALGRLPTLEGVGHQVAQDLLEPERVGDDVQVEVATLYPGSLRQPARSSSTRSANRTFSGRMVRSS